MRLLLFHIPTFRLEWAYNVKGARPTPCSGAHNQDGKRCRDSVRTASVSLPVKLICIPFFHFIRSVWTGLTWHMDSDFFSVSTLWLTGPRTVRSQPIHPFDFLPNTSLCLNCDLHPYFLQKDHILTLPDTNYNMQAVRNLQSLCIIIIYVRFKKKVNSILHIQRWTLNYTASCVLLIISDILQANFYAFHWTGFFCSQAQRGRPLKHAISHISCHPFLHLEVLLYVCILCCGWPSQALIRAMKRLNTS